VPWFKVACSLSLHWSSWSIKSCNTGLFCSWIHGGCVAWAVEAGVRM
jgi:hypothetical protein